MTTTNLHDNPGSTPGTGAGNARRPRALPLRHARDAKRLLAKLVNEVRRGDVDPRRASCVGFLVNSFIGACAAAEVDERIAALEARLGIQP